MKNIARYKKSSASMESYAVFMTSSEGRTGREELLRYISVVNQSITPEMYSR